MTAGEELIEAICDEMYESCLQTGLDYREKHRDCSDEIDKWVRPSLAGLHKRLTPDLWLRYGLEMGWGGQVGSIDEGGGNAKSS